MPVFGQPAPRINGAGGGFGVVGTPAPRSNTPMGTRTGFGGAPRPSPRFGDMRLASPSSFKKGGKVKKTGWAKVHKGERITPAGAAANAMGGKKKKAPKTKRAKNKIKKTMGEWKKGTLHSGSRKGPVVKNQKQAVAIAISQARKKA